MVRDVGNEGEIMVEGILPSGGGDLYCLEVLDLIEESEGLNSLCVADIRIQLLITYMRPVSTWAGSLNCASMYFTSVGCIDFLAIRHAVSP